MKRNILSEFMNRNRPNNHNIYEKKMKYECSRSMSLSKDSRSSVRSIAKVEKVRVSNTSTSHWSGNQQNHPITRAVKPRIPFKKYANLQLHTSSKKYSAEQLFSNNSFFPNNGIEGSPLVAEKSPSLPSSYLPVVNIFDNISSDVSINQSQVSSLPSNIHPQPCSKLFLCRNCYQFYATQEVREHNKLCRFGGRKRQYLQKWEKMTSIVKIASVQDGTLKNNQLYGLAEKMKKCIVDGMVRDVGDLLLEASNYQSEVFHMSDLLWLMQKLGGQINKEGNNSEKFVWLPCKG